MIGEWTPSEVMALLETCNPRPSPRISLETKQLAATLLHVGHGRSSVAQSLFFTTHLRFDGSDKLRDRLYSRRHPEAARAKTRAYEKKRLVCQIVARLQPSERDEFFRDVFGLK